MVISTTKDRAALKRVVCAKHKCERPRIIYYIRRVKNCAV